MSTRLRIAAVLLLLQLPCLGCGSKEAEGVPPGVNNLPLPPDREKGAKASFELSVQPEVVTLAQGGKAKLRVTANRKGYDGPIVIELSNLPAKVSAASKATLAAGAKEVEVEIIAAADADVGQKTDVTAMVASNPPVASRPFTIKVEKAAAVEAAPQFELRVDPELVKITQGDKIKVRVSAERNGFDGPIVIELANMPGLVTATKGTIAAGEKDVVLELTADAKAAAGETKGVTALGNSKTISSPFTIAIAEAAVLFELRVKDEVVEVKQGDKVKLDVSIVRKSYEGPVILELSNLPEKVTVGKVTIPEGKSRKLIEIVADMAAPEGKKMGVTVLASADGKTILSRPFAIVVTKGTSTSETLPFTLKTEKSEVILRAGTKIKVRITATRQNNYQGPITVELKGLPPVVKSGKLTLKEGQSDGEIEVWALATAPTGQITDVTPVGTAGDAKDKQIVSQVTLTINVLGAPVVVGPVADAVWFDVKIEPKTMLNIRPGTAAVIRVSVSRKNNFAGPVTVQLKSLPNWIQLKAPSATIPKNQTYADFRVFALQRTPIGSTANVTASGTGTFMTVQQQQTSPAITITAVKK